MTAVVGSQDDHRRIEALQFAASLRGASTKEDALLWGLQRGYYSEQDVNGQMAYHLTMAGREYADKVILETKPTGGTRWLPPVLALGVLALVIGKVFRR